MHLHSLFLRDFRNFLEQRFEFGPGFNILTGRNAQGKTNVLESIAVLSTGKSFRTSENTDLIAWQGGPTTVFAHVSHEHGEDEWKFTLFSKEKSLERNGKPISPRSRHALATVLFSPEEILLIRESPSHRRNYVDHLLSRFIIGYSAMVRSYEKVVAQRNRLLGDEFMPAARRQDLLSPFNQQLVDIGTKIVGYRQVWTVRLNEELALQYAAFAENDDAASLHYMPFFGETAVGCVPDLFWQRLAERREDECLRRVSLVGPHRDDFVPKLGSLSVRHFGSQGQHRSFVLALKMAEMELTRKILGYAPILLLDDVASELDEARNRHFFDYLQHASGIQVFVTTTDLKLLKVSTWNRVRCYDVIAGKASPRPV
ncbi:MAG: DNA replication/repair protein RecF [Deltaproteobacteria bacterium]|nr:DNA replication/repair protein RecF [Deltaproteobacteria bacterium]